jgi:glycosyltransferase involved in cell wall biosynthesis
MVTIGITCFDAAYTIRRAVLSAINQTWPNKEIVIVDDASTDSSPSVLEELERECTQLRVIRHPVNKGYAGALNTIMHEARGEFVAIFDDDDESEPDRVAAQWRRIVAHEAAHKRPLILCYTNRNVVKAEQSQPDHIAYAIGRRSPEPHGAIVADYIFGNGRNPRFTWGMFGSCTLMARGQTFATVGPFDESFRRCAEWDYAVRAASMGAHFIANDATLVTQHKTAGADKVGRVALEYALKLRAKHKNYLQKKHLYWSSRAMAHCNFYGARGQAWKSRGYFALACLASPFFISGRIANRIRALIPGGDRASDNVTGPGHSFEESDFRR